ncbi:MAG: ArsC/Spx/MgsR family protein [Mycobacteriales bacterium]|nr:ArsC/Spx/MgsR family protein [Mycobacteriales bacterium]
MIVWHHGRCSKSRGALELLRGSGVEPTIRLYLEDPPTRDELAWVLERVDVPLTRPDYRGSQDRDAVLDALVRDPSLIERPVVISGDRAVVARPPERVRELLD